MTGLSLATCDRALAPDGMAPEWVHLFPAGKMTGRDGRAFDLADPAALMLDFQVRGLDLPVDYEHRNDRPTANGPVPAAGWIKELKVDEAGLWGRVEWTETAREMIGKREYRYLSPSFLFHQNTRQIVRLNGAGLVHNPNLHLTALASEETGMNSATPVKTDPSGTATLSRLTEALGLPPGSDIAAILTALLGALQTEKATAAQEPDPARFVPIGAVQDLLADRNTRIATMREEEATRKVERAFREGYITPAMREWAMALCTQDPDSFDTFLAKSPAPFAHLTQPLRLPDLPPRLPAMMTGEEAAICGQLGLKPGSLID
ncbi:MAG: phage protease [Gemmobacter sp.]|jgi:phage I-like protein|nr:phage protease [Gemmobacter sp.]